MLSFLTLAEFLHNQALNSTSLLTRQTKSSLYVNEFASNERKYYCINKNEGCSDRDCVNIDSLSDLKSQYDNSIKTLELSTDIELYVCKGGQYDLDIEQLPASTKLKILASGVSFHVTNAKTINPFYYLDHLTRLDESAVFFSKDLITLQNPNQLDTVQAIIECDDDDCDCSLSFNVDTTSDFSMLFLDPNLLDSGSEVKTVHNFELDFKNSGNLFVFFIEDENLESFIKPKISDYTSNPIIKCKGSLSNYEELGKFVEYEHSSSSPKATLTTAQIIGIVIGCVGFVALVIIIIVLVNKKKMGSKKITNE